LGALIIWGLVRLFGLSLWGTNRRLLFIRGAIGTIAALCQVQAIFTLPIAAAMVLFFTFPIFSAILSPWINHEPTSKTDWLFIILAVVGTTLILWPEDLKLGFDINYIFPLVGSFLAGLVASLLRKLRVSNNPMTLYFYMCIVGAAVCLWPTMAQGAGFIPTLETSVGLILVAVLATIGQLAMNQGFKFLSAPRGGVLMMSETVMGSLAGVIFFNEPLGLKFVIGALMVIISGAMLTLRPPAARKAPS
jgi:drug/metabolite transporter (DMT)-like permease